MTAESTPHPPSAPPRDRLEAPPPATAAPPGGWAVGTSHAFAWWREGWRIFTRSPWVWIGVSLVLLALLYGLPQLPIIGGIAAPLLVHVLVAGLLVGAQALDSGQPLTFGHLFACFDRRAWPLMGAGLLSLVAWFVVWLIALGVCGAIFGYSSLEGLVFGDLTELDLTSLATLGAAMITALSLVLVLGTPLMMAYWFTPPLIALRGDGVISAFKASFAASVRNLPPLMVFGLVGMALAFVAAIPVGLGLLMLGPVFLAAIYASYRDIFVSGR